MKKINYRWIILFTIPALGNLYGFVLESNIGSMLLFLGFTLLAICDWLNQVGNSPQEDRPPSLHLKKVKVIHLLAIVMTLSGFLIKHDVLV